MEMPAFWPAVRAPLPSPAPAGTAVAALVSVGEGCILELRSEVLNVELSAAEWGLEGGALVSTTSVESVDFGGARVVLVLVCVLFGGGNDTGPLPPGGGSIRVAVMTPCVGWIALGCSLHI